MNIRNYFLSLSDEINKINSIINQTVSDKDKYNPFLIHKYGTYVWIEKDTK